MTRRNNLDTTPQQRADRLHEQAQALEDDNEALRLYQAALDLDARRPTTFYNIGLIHKYRGAWALSLEFNRRAIELSPDDEAANWNLAIAATAMRDWRAARQAWRRVGIEVDEGDAPIEGDFGMTPVRLNPNDDGEVVWGQRLDPVRARIDNIPYPSSGFRCGDVVLHDGAPVGEREWRGKTYSVFNVLELFEPSAHATFEAEVTVASDADRKALTQALLAAGVTHEDWTESVRVLCKQCSEGTVHEQHDHGLAADWQGRRVIGVATDDPKHAKAVLSAWADGHRRLVRFECRLESLPRH
jgi:tetratricopeptide (TPR) repeat protein